MPFKISNWQSHKSNSRKIEPALKLNETKRLGAGTNHALEKRGNASRRPAFRDPFIPQRTGHSITRAAPATHNSSRPSVPCALSQQHKSAHAGCARAPLPGRQPSPAVAPLDSTLLDAGPWRTTVLGDRSLAFSLCLSRLVTDAPSKLAAGMVT